MNRFNRLWITCAVGVCMTLPSVAADSAAPAQDPALDVRVTMPARVIDGDPLTAVVQIRNATGRELRIDEPRAYLNVLPHIEFVTKSTDACLVRRASTPNPLAAPSRRLLPGDGTTTSIDLTGDFPVGLRPGRYSLTITYRGTVKVTSAPVEFEVVAPADVTSYARFREVCGALLLNRRGSTEDVLALATSHPSIPYRAGLLNVARLRARGDVRAAIDRLLIEQHRDELGAEAEEDLNRIEWRKKDEALRVQHERALAAELADPSNADAARDFRRLGSIARSEQFEQYERFLSAHGRSIFASMVLQSMIDAVGEGVFPPGATEADCDRVIRGYYERLLRDYPESYPAQKARHNPTAQRLLALPTQ